MQQARCVSIRFTVVVPDVVSSGKMKLKMHGVVPPRPLYLHGVVLN
jgi:hypothetical protein